MLTVSAEELCPRGQLELNGGGGGQWLATARMEGQLRMVCEWEDQTDRQTDRHRQTDRQTDGLTGHKEPTDNQGWLPACQRPWTWIQWAGPYLMKVTRQAGFNHTAGRVIRLLVGRILRMRGTGAEGAAASAWF